MHHLRALTLCCNKGYSSDQSIPSLPMIQTPDGQKVSLFRMALGRKMIQIDSVLNNINPTRSEGRPQFPRILFCGLAVEDLSSRPSTTKFADYFPGRPAVSDEVVAD
jgi:hypothetical protein